MKERFKRLYAYSTLATKIRYSYLLVLVPMILFPIICFYNLWIVNRNYEDMINSTVVASEFNLDFKKDFDYETYLVIVENKTIEESKLDHMLDEAKRIVRELRKYTITKDNMDRLNSVSKYLDNLEVYIGRIAENLIEGSRYEDNIEIWENDVQIVTSLVQDTVFQYIYYEINELQQAHVQYQRFFMRMSSMLMISFAGVLLMVILLSYYIPLSITQPIRKLSEVTDQVAKGDLTVRFNERNGIEVSVLSDSLNIMIDKINELFEQVTKEQVRLRKAEFELLQSQINPHFLYNTLDAIVWLAEAGEQKKVVSMVGSLSEFFRTSLNQGKGIVPIREELQHVRSYLEIQQVRYQDILQYEIHVPAELYQYMIPKITIQPLVENALYHGIKNKRGQGMIVISGRVMENCFSLQIEDNGIGIKAEDLDMLRKNIQHRISEESDSYGLYNVNERIRLNFGEKYGISIESEYGEGTVVDIILPYVVEH